MGFWDALLGRSKPVEPDIDRLFSLPSASLTLQASLGYVPTGAGSVCFASVEGGVFRRMEGETRALLEADTGRTDEPVEFSRDEYGYSWVLSRRDPTDLPALVSDLHAVNTTLQDGGFGPQLLCSLVSYRSPELPRLALVYLYKRGTFYPFVPVGGRRRDNTLELRVRAAVTDDLPVEPDLNRWFPLWGAPGMAPDR